MQAIILAAGMGRRLKELTKDNTKCMVKVNDVTLIERMLRQLDARNLSRIVIVVGYQGQNLINHIETLNINTPIVFITNEVYDKTNNIYSLFLARKHLLEEDTMLLESDLIFDGEVLDLFMDSENDSIALVDKFESWMSGTCVKLSDRDEIIDFVSPQKFNYDEKDDYYKTVNIYKFTKDFSCHYYVPFLEAYQEALGKNEYYEQVLKVITMVNTDKVKATKLSGQRWYEIDDIQDLDIAESIFTEDDDRKVDLLNRRYGGYWRYPKMLDFCYLVNPYYPPRELKDELKASFDTLLTEYPSGMQVNSLLAAKNFSLRQDSIVVGNGAAELIKSLMENLEGKVGFVRPTFEEYPNRYSQEESVNYIPENDDLRYTAQDIMAFFDDKEIKTLIVVNPDNPSGNYIPQKDLLQLVNWSKEKDLRLLVDESFIDFSDEEGATLLHQEILDANPHLFVMKSISKSYGVPGLRLGILASGDFGSIAKVKKDVSIWNINSFAEFYMQIAEKYKQDYVEAMELFRQERNRFAEELNRIEGIRVIPSQANYFMLALDEGLSSAELLKALLTKHEILVKDLTSKIGKPNYIRIAIRNKEDNDRLLEALATEIKLLKA